MGTALVTGASSGIGRAFCHELAERGHDLVVVARDRRRLEDLSDELSGRHGIDVEILVTDLADRTELQRVADRAGDAERPVDLLVNNAGFGLTKPTLDADLADEERMLAVLCRAVLVLSHAAGRAMRARGRGAIINVASVAGFLPEGSYSAGKAWVTTFSEALSAQLARSGVTVTALCPGFTRTEFQQRAGMDMDVMDSVPRQLWLDPARVAAECLRDVAAGKVISVPGATYRAVVALVPFVPRSLLRRAVVAAGSRRRR